MQKYMNKFLTCYAIQQKCYCRDAKLCLGYSRQEKAFVSSGDGSGQASDGLEHTVNTVRTCSQKPTISGEIGTKLLSGESP